jgi:tRNA (cytidine/uridine-2'-O-)-methyltransferase
MIQNHPQICLFQPEIPQNAGNIGRLAAASGSRLHMIKPFGFGTEDKNLRRSGLDYWPFLDLEIHADLPELLERFTPTNRKVAFFSKFATKPYWEAPDETELFVFGRETSGLPQELHDQFPDSFYQIPMYHPGVRSLNLANAVSILVYDRIARLEGKSHGHQNKIP